MLKNLIQNGYVAAPVNLVIYSAEGVGKSTFAANAPAPLFIDFEKGSNFLNVSRIKPDSYGHFLEILKMLETEEHQFQTLVVDSVDFAEQLISDYVCRQHKKNNIEEWGYGAGYKYLAKEFINFLNTVDRLRLHKAMNIIFIAHSTIKKFEDPRLQQSYDRYTLKLHHSNADRLKESCDFLFYATYQDMTVGGADNTKARGISTGKRQLMTQRTPAYDAKTRVPLPTELDLSWQAFYEALYPNTKANQAA